MGSRDREASQAIYWYAEATNSVECVACGFTFNPGAAQPDSEGVHTCKYCVDRSRALARRWDA